MIATSFGSGQVAYSILWFFLFFIEAWLVISVFIDLFRSHDLPGWSKALWVILLLVFPLLGVLAYFILRGNKLRAHQNQAHEMQEALRQINQDASTGQRSKVEDLSRLAALRDAGHISAEEFERLKAEILDRDSTS